MSLDPAPTPSSTKTNLRAPVPVTVNWLLHRRLRTEGRLNLLFHLSEPLASALRKDCATDPKSRPNILPFISRAEHRAWRAHWKKGRWVQVNPSPEFRDLILRQDDIYRQADTAWVRRHGPAGGAKLLSFPQRGASELRLSATSSDCNNERGNG